MVRMPMVKGKYIYIYAYIKFQIEPKEKYLQIRLWASKNVYITNESEENQFWL